MHIVDFNKWMREKAKIFLVVICAIIMVTWLVPWNYLLGRRLGPQGKIFGKVVPAQQVDALAMTLSSLSSRRPERRGGPVAGLADPHPRGGGEAVRHQRRRR